MINELKITPIGGVGEVGALNCMVYETKTEAILIDCGSMFPDNETLGIDLIIPDFSYLRSIKHKLKAIVYTHGHEDHIGGNPYLMQEFGLPIYATPFTCGLLKERASEYHFDKKLEFHPFEPGESVQIGNFEIDSIFVNHSISDACALVIKTKGGNIVHLTDWKVDKDPPNGKKIDLKKFEKKGKEGVLALFSDSTNATQAGATLSEREVSKQIKKICSKHKGRILITMFASNIDRIQELVKIAKALGRKLVFVGRSMHGNTKLAEEIGRLNFEGVEVLDVEETRNLPDEEVLLLVTGTQGEPRSALTRMAFAEFKPFKIKEGDLVLFSSKMIPGNEKNVYSVINHLSKQGAQVFYETFRQIHTSGHAQQDELKLILKKLKPKYFIPIHGEYRHMLRHAELAQDAGVKRGNAFVIENGQTLDVQGSTIELGGKVPVGRVLVDGSGEDLDQIVLRDRRQMASTGLVVCVLMVNRDSGELLRDPELISHGLVAEENQEVLVRAKKHLVEEIQLVPPETRTDFAVIQEHARVTLRRFFRKELERKPVVIPVVQEV